MAQLTKVNLQKEFDAEMHELEDLIEQNDLDLMSLIIKNNFIGRKIQRFQNVMKFEDSINPCSLNLFIRQLKSGSSRRKSFRILCTKLVENIYQNIQLLPDLLNSSTNPLYEKLQMEIVSGKSKSKSKSNLSVYTVLLKVQYLDSNDTLPQELTLTLNEASTFSKFMHLFKKKLGIFPYSDFKIVLMKHNQEVDFLKKLDQLDRNDCNHIKVVTTDYKLKI